MSLSLREWFAGGTQELRLAECAAAVFALLSLVATPAHAESFVFGDAKLTVDTTVSIGATMRVSDRDCTRVSLENGGCLNADGRKTGINSDNGNLNFNKWDVTNAVAKATIDVEGSWENYGFFLRPTAFYDYIYAKNDLRFRNLDSDGKDALDYNVDILDAFVYGNWDIDGHATTARLGKQVLNWGESLFIMGGINSFQAIDVARIRTPGAELKDALTPMPMIFASTAITPNLSAEAFWQFGYEKTELDPAGSFFSTGDIVGRGSLPAMFDALIDNPDLAFPPGTFPPNSDVPIAVRRSADRIASETNQFGLALRYYAENLGDGVDFGLYAVRYTSRLPYLGFTTGPDDLASACVTVQAILGPAPCGTSSTDPLNEAAFAYAAGKLKYFMSYPTIETLGASFATTIGGTAVSGEIAYSPNMPFSVSDMEQNASQIDGTGAAGPMLGAPGPVSSLPGAGPNQDTVHMIRLDALQGQIGTISAFTATDRIPSLLKADSAFFIVNAGFVYVPDAGDWPLSRNGREAGIRNPYAAAILSPTFTNPQYPTSFSSGYRAVLLTTYNSAFGTPFSLSPYIAWRHDVIGWSPGPNTALYTRGLKTISVGVNADYQNTWRASVSYTNSFGGGFDNAAADRDFVMASLSYSF